MAFGEKGIIEKYRDNRLWNKISLRDLQREMRRLDVEIRTEEGHLRNLGKNEMDLKQRAKGRPEIEKRGIAKEIKSLRREGRAHEAMVTNLYNQRTTFNQISLYKKMEVRAKRKGMQKQFRKHQDRIIGLITDKGIDITDEMDIWKTLAQETDVAFQSILATDAEEDEILAELEENEMDDDIEDLESYLADDKEDEEIVTLEKRKVREKK